MAIAFSNLGASSVSATNPDILNTTDLNAYANSSWTPPTADLIFVFVYNAKATTAETPTMSGNSLTWTNIKTVEEVATSSQRLTLFGANASGSTTGATTVDFGGVTQIGCAALFAAATGVDLTGGVAAAFVQSVSNGNTGFGDTTGTVTLASASAADNRPISGWWHQANQAKTPEWTELDDVNTSGGPTFGLETQYSDSFDTSATVSWTGGVPWMGIAAELKATAGGAPPVVDPFGMMGFFGA